MRCGRSRCDQAPRRPAPWRSGARSSPGPPLARRSGGDPGWSARAATGPQRPPRPALPARRAPRGYSRKVPEVRGRVALPWKWAGARGEVPGRRAAGGGAPGSKDYRAEAEPSVLARETWCGCGGGVGGGGLLRDGRKGQGEELEPLASVRRT